MPLSVNLSNNKAYGTLQSTMPPSQHKNERETTAADSEARAGHTALDLIAIICMPSTSFNAQRLFFVGLVGLPEILNIGAVLTHGVQPPDGTHDAAPSCERDLLLEAWLQANDV